MENNIRDLLSKLEMYQELQLEANIKFDKISMICYKDNEIKTIMEVNTIAYCKKVMDIIDKDCQEKINKITKQLTTITP